MRAKAEIASQGGFPNKSDANVDPNLLQNEQGILIARQKAVTSVNLDAHAANARNLENMIARNEKINFERNARGATAEVMGMGLSLGSAHAAGLGGEYTPGHATRLSITYRPLKAQGPKRAHSFRSRRPRVAPGRES